MHRQLPRLIVITDWRMPRSVLLERLDAALSLGPAVAVQHRHPEVAIRPFLEEAHLLAELCRKRGNPLFINGRLDVALLVGADLHLPARSLTPSDVRPHLPSEAWVSIAVHDFAEARAAEGADLALISPVFAPGSKPNDERRPLGPDGFAQLADQLKCAPFALGGIRSDRVARLPRAAGYAVVSAVLQAEEPARAASEILRSTSNPTA